MQMIAVPQNQLDLELLAYMTQISKEDCVKALHLHLAMKTFTQCHINENGAEESKKEMRELVARINAGLIGVEKRKAFLATYIAMLYIAESCQI